MVYQDACRFLGIEPTWTPDALLPPPLVPHVTITAGDKTDEKVLWEVVKRVYDIESDDARLRAETDDRTALFDNLRKNYPIRREFRFTSVTIKNTSTQLQNTFERLGFRKG